MIRFYSFLIIILAFSDASAQNLDTISILSTQLNEISGIEKIDNNTFICHNDGGNATKLYLLDSNGTISGTIFLDSISNVDYEDITIDNNGNLYLADVGNNNFNRTNLVIYKIASINNYLSGNDTVVPEKIFISYQDQTTFPDTNQNTDCEAIVFYQNNLYLFSKDWSGNGYTKIYRVPTTPGTYNLSPHDTITNVGFITGADLMGDTLVLLQMNTINLYYGFSTDTFSNSTRQYFTIALSQKEGVCFVNPNKLYVTQEHHSFFNNPILYSFSLPTSSIKENYHSKLKIYPNPTQQWLYVDITNQEKSFYKLYNSSGVLIKQGAFDKKIDVSILKKGNYYLKVKNGNTYYYNNFVKN